MIPRTSGQVAAATGGRLHGAPDLIVDAVATDSRRMPPGAPLFVALRGASSDGHDHVASAVAAGARAVLVERRPADLAADPGVPVIEVPDTWAAIRALAAVVRREVDPQTVAITGSVGKTTVKDLTATAVGVDRRVHAAAGSHNNELGVPLTLLGLQADTQVLVAEVGARHLGDVAHLAEVVAPDVAVVTRVAPVHLEVFGTVEAIATAKAELVDALGPDGVAVLNADDPRVAAMADRAPAVLRVGTAPSPSASADVTVTDVRLDALARPTARIRTPWGDVEVRLPLAGAHHVLNAAFALAVAGHLGVDLDRAATALATATVSPWRGAVDRAGGVTVLNDAYNANPTAVRAALATLVAVERRGRTWAVLGEMAEIGDTSAAEHHAVGARCAQLGVDRVVAVGEVATAIATGARQSGLPDDQVHVVADARAAVSLLTAEVTTGDVVLVKASRVAGLERVAAALTEALDADAGAEGRRP